MRARVLAPWPRKSIISTEIPAATCACASSKVGARSSRPRQASLPCTKTTAAPPGAAGRYQPCRVTRPPREASVTAVDGIATPTPSAGTTRRAVVKRCATTAQMAA
jgi:hypothetical protein